MKEFAVDSMEHWSNWIENYGFSPIVRDDWECDSLFTGSPSFLGVSISFSYIIQYNQ